MVYCGKPSRGCHACRKRKTRCDARPEGCTQCENAGRECPGYRSEVDLLFRDQSSAVVRKAEKTRKPKAATTTTLASRTAAAVVTSHVSPGTKPRWDTGEGDAIDQREWEGVTSFDPTTFILRPTIEEVSKCHFMFNYPFRVRTRTMGIKDTLSLLYQSSRATETLDAAVRAASVASFANHARLPEAHSLSIQEYTTAIQLVNTALQDPTKSRDDATLLAIMILGMYEQLTGRTRTSLEAWRQHVRGACALLKLRGPQQMQTPIGRRLFVQASVEIATLCMQYDMPMPKYLMQTARELPKLTPPYLFGKTTQQGFDVLYALFDVVQFRAEVVRAKIASPHEIIARALEMDRKAISKFFGEAAFEYRIEHVPPTIDMSEIVYNNIYHVYDDLFVASLANTARLVRAVLHLQVIETLDQSVALGLDVFDLARYEGQHARSRAIVIEMQGEMLATVPQHLGFVVRTDLVAGFDGSAEEIVTPTYVIRATLPEDAKAEGGMNIFWPLFFAGVLNLATDEVRKYCIRNLRRIGEDFGIRQASLLAFALETKVNLTSQDDAHVVELVE